MTSDDSTGSMLRMLSRLPGAVPNAARSARARARCHAVLARRQQRRAAIGALLTPRAIESALVGGFCLCYVSAVILDALVSQGIL